MKLRGEFVVRQVLNNTMAIPVGETALRLNGMILLNAVSRVIWECLAQGAQPEDLVVAVTDAFDISAGTAEADIAEFLDKLRAAGLLDE